MLQVYNTMTRKKEAFHPLEDGKASIYCCGVTPYNHPHIGNARPFVTWDVIRRYLAKKGFEVHYVQNFTDVDDKIIRAANEEKVSWKEIADRYIASYYASMDALNVRRADCYPRVSETMEDILAMVKALVDKGYAYALDNGDVFYSVERFPEYGKLSGRKLEEMQAGARVDVDERKHHPMDFALWKAAKPGEPSWDSPWGKGRPGWHIECSAMSLKYLGKTFDFHGGGSDLIFPHHENEIAQSQACIGDCHSFARYWLHNGFVTIRDEKMSKSKNNFFTVRDILKEYAGEVIRFFILQTHYRSPLDFSDDRLKEAKAGLARLANTKAALDGLVQGGNSQGENTADAVLAARAEKLRDAFYEAMDDDFNTALAISYMFELSKEINIRCQAAASGKEPADRTRMERVREIYLEMAEIIGILEQEAISEENDDLTDTLMGIIIELRQDARRNKNWAVADRIRDALKDAGILLEDTPQGVRWKRA